MENVARLSLELFDALKAADLHELGDWERELLWAACTHEFGVTIDHDERSRDGSIAAVELDDRESCVILRPVIDGGPQSDPSVAIWSAQRNSDILAEAIGKPVGVVGSDP